MPFSDPDRGRPRHSARRGTRLESRHDSRARFLKSPAIRETSQIPLLLFTYLNPVMRYGFEALARDAKAAGIDGCLLTDVSVEEAEPYVAAMRAARTRHGVSRRARLSTPERLKLVAEYSTGFVYLVSRTGVTGEQSSLSDALAPPGDRRCAPSRSSRSPLDSESRRRTGSRGRTDRRWRGGGQRVREDHREQTGADSMEQRLETFRALAAARNGPMIPEMRRKP